MKDQNLDELLRQTLFQSVEEEFQQAMEAELPVPPPTLHHRCWEAAFLGDPIAACSRRKRGRTRRFLQAAACLALVVAVSIGATVAFFPEARAAVTPNLAEPTIDQAENKEIDLTFQLGGSGGCDFVSQHFSCVKENGNTLYYSFENTMEEACTVRLFKVGLFKHESVGEVLTVAPGEFAFGTYPAPKNDTFFLRVTGVMGGISAGRSRRPRSICERCRRKPAFRLRSTRCRHCGRKSANKKSIGK